MSNMLRFTPEQLREHQQRIGRQLAAQEAEEKKITPQKPVKQVEPSKHRNKIVMVDGIKFHSQREAARWQELKLLEAAGKITELRRQVPFVLMASVILDGRKKPDWRYFADFAYLMGGVLIVEDCKNEFLRKDGVFRAKRHALKLFHGIEILLT